MVSLVWTALIICSFDCFLYLLHRMAVLSIWPEVKLLRCIYIFKKKNFMAFWLLSTFPFVLVAFVHYCCTVYSAFPEIRQICSNLIEMYFNVQSINCGRIVNGMNYKQSKWIDRVNGKRKLLLFSKMLSPAHGMAAAQRVPILKTTRTLSSSNPKHLLRMSVCVCVCVLNNRNIQFKMMNTIHSHSEAHAHTHTRTFPSSFRLRRCARWSRKCMQIFALNQVLQ